MRQKKQAGALHLSGELFCCAFYKQLLQAFCKPLLCLPSWAILHITFRCISLFNLYLLGDSFPKTWSVLFNWSYGHSFRLKVVLLAKADFQPWPLTPKYSALCPVNAPMQGTFTRCGGNGELRERCNNQNKEIEICFSPPLP